MCTLPGISVASPNQVLSEKLGTKAQETKLTPKQAALQLCDQMAEQVKRIVRGSFAHESRKAAASVVAAVVLVLTPVSIQEYTERM